MHVSTPRFPVLRFAPALLALSGLLCAGVSAAPPPVAPAPDAPLRPVIDIYAGPNGPVSVVDNYRWLEDGDDPAVKAWSSAENTRTRAYLSTLPGRDKIAGELRRFDTRLPTGYGAPTQRPNGLFALGFAPGKQQPYLVLLPSAASTTAAKTLFDPGMADPTGLTSIDFYVPSQTGKYVGISESHGGSEDGTLHIYDTATRRELPDQIARINYPTAGGSIAWDAEDAGFYYTRYPQPGEYTGADEYNYQQVYYHRIGTPSSEDVYSLGKDFPAIAETALQTSRDGRYTLADVSNGDGGQHAFYLHLPAGGWKKIAANEEGAVQARFGGDDALYLLSHQQGPNGCVLRLPAGATALAQAQVIVPQGAAAIDTIAPTEHTLYVFYITGGPSQVSAFRFDGSHRQDIPIPPVSSASNPLWTTGDALLYTVGSFAQPETTFQYAPGQTQSTPTALLPPGPDDFSDLVVRREFAVSKDGTRVPMSIIMERGTRLNGSNPTLIYGYGGYGISERPGFRPATALWCRSGGVYVDTNIRGGGEYGDAWHRAGNLLNKQNVFDDFAACARHLFERGYTRPGKLAATGASNGGLLMGAQITQYPDLYKCIVSLVGDYDMLRVELEPNGPTNTTEFGTVKDPAQFAALYAYSPYLHVRDGVRYPDILMVTGDNDGRVAPMNSRKMMARLQAAAAPGSLLLLRTSATAGHGIGSSRDERISQNADVQAFLMNELGMTPGSLHSQK